MIETDHDLARFSKAPLSEVERQTLRRDLKMIHDLRPVLNIYRNSKAFGRALGIIGTWVLPAIAGIVGVLVGLKQMNWWPFGGGG